MEISDTASEFRVTKDAQVVVELNVGGVYYSTSLETLRKDGDSCLAKMFSESNRHRAVKDAKGKYFIDRDGVLFRYVLDYLRNMKLLLPENFHEKERLRQEAEYFQLPNLVKIVNGYIQCCRQAHSVPQTCLDQTKDQPATIKHLTTQSSITSNSSTLTHQESSAASTSELALPSNNAVNAISTNFSPSRTPFGDKSPGYITIGYRGTFAFGRDGLADVKFRKLSRIIICGKVSLCREVFKSTLNESRDPDRGDCDRYTSRFFLKHSFLEQAFDMLQEEGFSLVGSCGSGTNSAGEIKAGLDNEEAKWQHYNEFIFERR